MERNGAKKTLVLIDPYSPDNPFRMKKGEMRVLWFPKLSTPVLAGLTPKTWDCIIVDESKDIVTPSWVVEMVQRYGVNNLFVGISTQMTCYTPRAYQIADWFRALGVKVILGGTHATYLPKEAKQHADSVVLFEADEIWHNVIKDFEEGTLQPFYKMGAYPMLQTYPRPRVDLLPKGYYMTNQCLQTTRGCHFDCDFCSVSPYNGKSTRRRTVDDVINEIRDLMNRPKPITERLRRFGLRLITGAKQGQIFAFVDDLHNSNREYCKKLWTALKELNIKWGAQCTLFLGNEPDMVKLAADSGCVAMFVGMESIRQDTLEKMNKSFNEKYKYEDQIKCFHDHGIMVNPGIIFGSDGEDVSVFEMTVSWLMKNKLELAYFNISTPLPGTKLFERMKAEGRIIDWNWENYDGKHVVFKPQAPMTKEILEQGFYWANREFFSDANIKKRIDATPQRKIQRWWMNRAFQNLVYRTTEPFVDKNSRFYRARA